MTSYKYLYGWDTIIRYNLFTDCDRSACCKFEKSALRPLETVDVRRKRKKKKKVVRVVSYALPNMYTLHHRSDRRIVNKEAKQRDIYIYKRIYLVTRKWNRISRDGMFDRLLGSSSLIHKSIIQKKKATSPNDITI